MLRSTRAHRRADKTSSLTRSRVVGVVTAFVAAVAIATGGAAGARADSPAAVTISDPALASCTATALGDTSGTTTTFDANAVAGLSNLSCSGVADVSQIGDYSGLTSLGLTNGSISDVEPIATLTNLTSVSLDGNHITDLRPLAVLTATITATDETYAGSAQTVGVLFALPTIHALDGSALAVASTDHATATTDSTFATTTATQASIVWGGVDFSVTWPITSALGTIASAPASAITGTVAVGQTLTATPGSWSDGVALSYQWLLDGSPIAAATGEQYVIPDTAMGRAISVATTGAEDGYTPATATSSALTVGAGVLTQPVDGPRILGTPTVFQRLSANPGTWAPDGVAFTYQWLRGGVAISRATGSSYVLSTADAGKAISVRITASRTGYTSTTLTAPSVTVQGAPLTRVITPVISGKAATGNTLSAMHGPWAPSGLTFAYRWNRNGSPISGAIHSTYKLGAADVHQSITVTVSGWKTGYASATRTSKAVTPALGTITNAPAPTIVGTVATGHIVTAHVGAWPGGVTVKTQWRRNGVNVSGATAKTYAIHSGDAGATISVVATGSKPGYKSLARVSAGHTVPKPAPPAPSCTNGTYVNSAGHTVCRPETASSPPAGATAKCKDGTYSFSESRSGTCSHHGGVAVWY